MAARKPKVTTVDAPADRLGVTVEVPDPAIVTLPDGTTRTVTGGRYVLDQPGEHAIRPA